MGDLDRVKAALLTRQTGPSARDLADKMAAKALDEMMERLSSPHVTPQEFKEGIAVLIKGLRGLSKQVEALKGEVQGNIKEARGELSRKPESFDSVLDAVSSLESNVRAMTNAIASIRLPEMPKIPEPKEVDLSPVLSSQDNIVALISALNQPTVIEASEPPPREWVFSFERSQGGLLRRVSARAV